MSQVDSAAGKHVPALDAVRGIAILLVMVFHFSAYGHELARAPIWIDQQYYAITRAGWMGVDLFFVLSGFLITGILYDAKGGAHYFRNFYVRRVLRIFPLYYGVLIVLLLILPRIRPDHGGLLALQQDAVWYWTYLSNIRIAFDGWPEFGAIGHFWSLAIEEQFYLVWPLLVFALSRRSMQVLCVLCIAGALAVRIALHESGNPVAAVVFTPARVGALSAGAFVALAARAPGGLAAYARWARPAIAFLGVALVAMFVLRDGLFAQDPVVSTVGFTLLALLFAAVLVLVLTAKRDSAIAKGFDSPTLRFFGKYSYGLYVFHHPLLFFAPGIVPLGMIPAVGGSQLLRQGAFLIIATASSLAIAMASWHLYEKQFLKLKAFFPYQAKRLS